ncbi:MAG TPA: TIGR02679 family protein [Polyangia bacterium]
MSVDLERLRPMLGGSSLDRLRRRVRERIARGGELGSMTVTDATAEERSTLDSLFGRVSRGRSLRVDLGALETVLREAGICADLKGAMEALDGPIEDSRALRSAEEAAWRRVFDSAGLRLRAEPRLSAWLSELEATGLLRRASGGDVDEGEALLAAACAVLLHLPAKAMPLAEFAAQTTGDTHGLDIGQPLSALLMRAIARVTGMNPPDDSETRREVWAAVGVLCDELSAPVLVLNLRANSDSPTARALAIHAEAGEPYRVSTRQLLRAPLTFSAASAVVYVCENPTIVAIAADRLGPRSAPLICTEGTPKTAFASLARQLVEAGVTLRYHGDFDWPGVQIANLLVKRFGADPWRLGPNDYLRAPLGPPLEGEPVTASWSPDLTSAMRRHGRASHEEQVVDDLLADLAEQ